MDDIINPDGHTRTPWNIEENDHDFGDDCVELRGDSDSKPIAIIFKSFFSSEHKITKEEREADAKEYALNAKLLLAAPQLLEKCREYSSDCEDRISALNEDEIYQCACHTEYPELFDEDGEPKDENVVHGRHCDTGQQIEHWKATKKMVDDVIASAS